MKIYDFLKEATNRLDESVESFDYNDFDHYSRIIEHYGFNPLSLYQEQIYNDAIKSKRRI